MTFLSCQAELDDIRARAESLVASENETHLPATKSLATYLSRSKDLMEDLVRNQQPEALKSLDDHPLFSMLRNGPPENTRKDSAKLEELVGEVNDLMEKEAIPLLPALFKRCDELKSLLDGVETQSSEYTQVLTGFEDLRRLYEEHLDNQVQCQVSRTEIDILHRALDMSPADLETDLEARDLLFQFCHDELQNMHPHLNAGCDLSAVQLFEGLKDGDLENLEAKCNQVNLDNQKLEDKLVTLQSELEALNVSEVFQRLWTEYGDPPQTHEETRLLISKLQATRDLELEVLKHAGHARHMRALEELLSMEADRFDEAVKLAQEGPAGLDGQTQTDGLVLQEMDVQVANLTSSVSEDQETCDPEECQSAEVITPTNEGFEKAARSPIPAPTESSSPAAPDRSVDQYLEMIQKLTEENEVLKERSKMVEDLQAWRTEDQETFDRLNQEIADLKDDLTAKEAPFKPSDQVPEPALRNLVTAECQTSFVPEISRPSTQEDHPNAGPLTKLEYSRTDPFATPLKMGPEYASASARIRQSPARLSRESARKSPAKSARLISKSPQREYASRKETEAFQFRRSSQERKEGPSGILQCPRGSVDAKAKPDFLKFLGRFCTKKSGLKRNGSSVMCLRRELNGGNHPMKAGYLPFFPGSISKRVRKSRASLRLGQVCQLDELLLVNGRYVVKYR